MIEVILEKNKLDFNGLKGFIRGFAELYLLAPLGHGNPDAFLAHRKNERYDLRYLIEKLQRQQLDSSEMAWFQSLRLLQKQIDSFDEKHYRSLDTDAKSRYITKYGFECAKILESLVEGYVSKSDGFCPASPNARKDATWEKWRKLISPINYLALCSKTVCRTHYVKTPKGEVPVEEPIDLNIIEN